MSDTELIWAWISQKFFSFNPIAISTTAQMHIFSTASNMSPKKMFVYKLKREDCHPFSPRITVAQEPRVFCFKYLIMCNQNPSEPKALPLLISIISSLQGADQTCLYIKFFWKLWSLLYFSDVYILYRAPHSCWKTGLPLGWDNINLCKCLRWLWHKAAWSYWFQCQRENLFNFHGWTKLNCMLEIFLFHLLKCC